MATNTKKTSVSDELEVKDIAKPKKYNDKDLIECKSVTNGKYFFTGKKSSTPYRWAQEGDIELVEYRDLLYAVREKNPCIFKPRIIVMDEEFINQNTMLKDFYDSMYTTSDFEKILDLSPIQMKKVIETLPSGAKDLLKGIVSTKINNGTLDSVRKIQTLDEVFNTQMLLMLASN